MKQVGIGHFLEAFINPFGRFRTLEGLKMDTDSRGEPFFIAGSGAVVFRIGWQGEWYAAKCYLRSDERQAAHRRAVDRLTAAAGPYLIPSRSLEEEVWIFDNTDTGAWHSLVLTKWVAGVSLGSRLRELCEIGDREALHALARAFDRMAGWLLRQPFAHGDLKPDNLMVTPDGGLKMIDYDAFFLPEMAGTSSPELGTPGFQHPARDRKLFDKHIDDYSLALISTALHALADFPEWYRDWGGDEGLLFDPVEAVAGTSALLARLKDHRIDRGQTALYRLAVLLGSPVPQLPELGRVLEGIEQMEERPVISITAAPNAWEIIRKNGLYGFCNTATGETIDPAYDAAGLFSEGWAPVRIGRRWLYIDRCGKKVLDGAAYDAVESFYEGLAVVRKGGRYGFLDTGGRFAVPLQWEEARRFSEGLACVRSGGKYGFIDREGRTVVAPRFDSAFDFREGFAVVGAAGRYGYIDRRGGMAIEPIYRFASGFRHGQATAENDDRQIRLVKQGGVILIQNEP
jgi:hypothetical protein